MLKSLELRADQLLSDKTKTNEEQKSISGFSINSNIRHMPYHLDKPKSIHNLNVSNANGLIQKIPQMELNSVQMPLNPSKVQENMR